MILFVQQLVNGLMLGSTYSLVAIGYTLILGTLNLLHFAHGEVFMMGAFFGLLMVLFWKVNFYVAIAGGMASAALVGILVELFAIRPIKKEQHLAPLISTIGVTIILQEAAHYFSGGEPLSFPETVRILNFDLGGIRINSVQLTIFGVSVFLMFVLHLFVKKTKMGKAMRATAESPTTAALLGISVHQVTIATFIIASALAGAAGVLVGLNYNAVTPGMGVSFAIKGFAIMLLGGLGNIYGAMLGGLILGGAEILSVGYLAPSYRDAFAFGLMILILIFRPSGILGVSLKKRA
ncbi:MAG: branched-chain amino acid ABC transporter permease [Nitrospinota bacterium]